MAEQHLHKRPHVRGLHEMIEEALGIGRRHRRGQQVAASDAAAASAAPAAMRKPGLRLTTSGTKSRKYVIRYRHPKTTVRQHSARSHPLRRSRQVRKNAR